MTYKQFNDNERIELSVLIKSGIKNTEIGKILNKDPVSIWREIKRGSKNGKYSSCWAKKMAKERKTHRKKKIENNQWLKKYIHKKLKLYWSPEQIAGRLRRDGFVICHETIYGYIIHHKKLKKYLRCQKGKYRRRHGTVLREKTREYKKKRWIGERSDIINQRTRIGDWEGDTILGSERTQRVLTHVERFCGYLMADKLTIVSAEIVARKTIARFKKLPKRKRLSITYDNGTEFSAHDIIERKAKISIYFANAYHSWERGTNENTNGLLRQFFPKRSSFDTVTQKEVDRVVRLINHRPRKRLNYLTPFEIFHCTSF
jgi:IS30 family transposase